MAGLLFARAGCRTVVLEKHADFLRDFRGDTVHPSTLEVMHELGLLDKFLERPHTRLAKLGAVFGGREMQVIDFSRLDAKCKFIAMMPQWHFLDFLSTAGASVPTFRLEMQAKAVDVIESGGRITGVRAETPRGPLEVRARLVIGADGRTSDIRARAGLKVQNIGAPIDVLWFRIGRDPKSGPEPLANTGAGHIVITIDRGDYYQCAMVIAKGAADRVRAEGLDSFRAKVVATAPRLAGHIADLKSLDDVKLLSVAIDRLEQWSRPGLVMIGDAAHAMSPVGGVGINLAIQDAVAAANLLAQKLHAGTLTDEDLKLVQKRRLWPVRATQFAQVQAQNNILARFISDKPDARPAPPLALRIISKVPWLQRRLASYIGLGARPEHVISPQVHTPVV